MQPEAPGEDTGRGPANGAGWAFPHELQVLIEQPRLSFIKRREDGRIDFISPLPCPFNYGSVPGSLAPDGDREDALVLGPRLRKGTRRAFRVLARVHFIDAGMYDGKWVCGHALAARDQRQLLAFFALYAPAKRWLNRQRGLLGRTHFEGLELASEPAPWARHAPSG